MRYAAIVGILLGISLTVGCKLEINVDEGGYVTTVSGNYTCQPGESCEIEIDDTSFNEQFYAVANPGYYFVQWRYRAWGFCWYDMHETCRLSTESFEGNDGLMAWLDSDTVIYLEPVFGTGECEDLSESWAELENGEEVTYRSEKRACPDYRGELLQHGIFRLWQNGVLASESHWSLGRQHGPENEWWPNANIKSQFLWRNGLKHGPQRHYDNEGNIWLLEYFSRGTWHGEIVNYDSEGNVIQLQTLYENRLHGPEKIYFDNGELKISRSYHWGELHGKERIYDNNGALRELRTWNNGIREGYWASYDTAGNIIEDFTYPSILKDLGNGLIRDRVLGITWTKDGNLFESLCRADNELATAFVPQDAASARDICDRDGKMTWNDARLWIDRLNNRRFKGYRNWRLPETGTEPTCAHDRCDNSELGQLYFRRLFTPDTEEQTCRRDRMCLIGAGPFDNIEAGNYWSGTLHPHWEDAFFFNLSNGVQDSDNFENRFHVWPVRSQE